MFGLSPAHLILILLVMLIVVGPGRLPETGEALGKAFRGFRDALEGRDTPSATAGNERPQPPRQSTQVAQQPYEPQPQPYPQIPPQPGYQAQPYQADSYQGPLASQQPPAAADAPQPRD